MLKQAILLPDDVEKLPGQCDVTELSQDIRTVLGGFQIMAFHIVVQLPQALLNPSCFNLSLPRRFIFSGGRAILGSTQC
jgi:hypothetical protein